MAKRSNPSGNKAVYNDEHREGVDDVIREMDSLVETLRLVVKRITKPEHKIYCDSYFRGKAMAYEAAVKAVSKLTDKMRRK